MSVLWFRTRFGAATAPRRRRSRGRQVVKWAAMELFNCLTRDHGQIPYLLAGLGDRFAGVSHFADELLRRFRIFAQTSGSLFKDPQDLPNTSLFLALKIGQFADAFAAHHQIPDNHFKLPADGQVLLTFRAINDSLQRVNQGINFALPVGAFFEKKAAQSADSPVYDFADAR